ncbi:MAG: hypothetical protein KIG98_07125 [Comamonas sp.]|nr:hypothetical protein [Comamonas sp.]
MPEKQSEETISQLTRDIAEIARDGLGVGEDEAARIAAVIVHGMRQRYGGTRLGRRGLYIPVPCKEERNAAVRREFNGTNGPEVMRRYGIKRSTLYTIVGKRSDTKK